MDKTRKKLRNAMDKVIKASKVKWYGRKILNKALHFEVDESGRQKSARSEIKKIG